MGDGSIPSEGTGFLDIGAGEITIQSLKFFDAEPRQYVLFIICAVLEMLLLSKLEKRIWRSRSLA